VKNLAILPVRSGSSRVKHKNIKLIAGHPLMYYQIECAKQVKSIDRIIVATDSEYYAQQAKSLSVEVVMRPPEISDGDSKSEETMLYVLDELEKQGSSFDNVILLQATCPLSRPEDIEEGIAIFKNSNFKSLLTYYEDKRFFLDDPDIIDRPMTQNKEPKKVEAGCFWITNVEAFKEQKNRICLPCKHMKVSKMAALDVDTIEDLRVAELFLEREMRLKEDKYFKKREYKGNFDDYYRPQVDPDGNTRNVLEEKERKIDFCKEEIKFINNLYKDESKRNLLDLGCGAGFVSSVINDNWNKYGLEISEEAAEVAKEYISKVHLGILEPETYPEEFFDLVFCHHVIEHVKEPVDFIKNIHKILKTHGHLIISTPNFDSGVAQRFGKNYRLLNDETHVSLFNDWGLRQCLEDYGFFIDKIDFPYFETEYFNQENLLRLFDISKVSPPFYGNIMSIYARKK